MAHKSNSWGSLRPVNDTALLHYVIKFEEKKFIKMQILFDNSFIKVGHQFENVKFVFHARKMHFEEKISYDTN